MECQPIEREAVPKQQTMSSRRRNNAGGMASACLETCKATMDAFPKYAQELEAIFTKMEKDAKEEFGDNKEQAIELQKQTCASMLASIEQTNGLAHGLDKFLHFVSERTLATSLTVGNKPVCCRGEEFEAVETDPFDEMNLFDKLTTKMVEAGTEGAKKTLNDLEAVVKKVTKTATVLLSMEETVIKNKEEVENKSLMPDELFGEWTTHSKLLEQDLSTRLSILVDKIAYKKILARCQKSSKTKRKLEFEGGSENAAKTKKRKGSQQSNVKAAVSRHVLGEVGNKGKKKSTNRSPTNFQAAAAVAKDGDSPPDFPSPETSPSAPAEARDKKKAQPKKHKKLKDIGHGSFYFKCPAPGCDKVSPWSNDPKEKETALQQGMVLLPEDPVTKCRQIDNNVQQMIPCLQKAGYSSMKDHMKRCELWQNFLREANNGKSPTNKGRSPDVDLNAPLYRDRRYKLKKDGSHNLTKKEKKDLENQKAKQERKASKEIFKAVAENWDKVEQAFASIGFKKADIPAKGDGFMFAEKEE